MTDVIEKLTADLGGSDKLNTRQVMLVEMAADEFLRAHMAMGRCVEDAGRFELDRHVVLLHSSLARLLRELYASPEPARDAGPTLSQYLDSKALKLVDAS